MMIFYYLLLFGLQPPNPRAFLCDALVPDDGQALFRIVLHEELLRLLQQGAGRRGRQHLVAGGERQGSRSGKIWKYKIWQNRLAWCEDELEVGVHVGMSEKGARRDMKAL